ncbi:hypothetical protein AQUCO_03700072v1 [Aquilegia coerulea]|uniref:PWWP domain-containing protein n=1 Tax=Aquilegia coerulea TaxID=218851 RepID=A0A2G5CUG8_AQUCA|nr:hypothetical protein AQUCO_03700072v1 [Aquilegia coerulea]
MKMMTKTTMTTTKKKNVSKFQSTRNDGKSESTKHFKKNSRVSDFNLIDNDADDDVLICSLINDKKKVVEVESDFEEEEEEEEKICDELEFRSSKDIVWANAYPYTWWPGWIRRRYRGKVLVSFFKCERTLWFREPEIFCFENNFEEMMSKINEKKLHPDAIACGLAKFGRRLLLEFTCMCKDDLQDTKERQSKIEVKKVFEPVEALDFVYKTAVSPTFDDEDSVRVIRAAAQVNAFRRYAFVERDWVYGETMRINEIIGDAEAEADRKSTCSEDEHASSLSEEVEFSDDDDEEDNHTEFVGKMTSGSVISKKTRKEPLEQHDFTQRSQITTIEVFQPVEALACVLRIAVSPWVNDVDTDNVIRVVAQINTFRQHAFIKRDWIYRETMRLTETTDEPEGDMKRTSSEDDQISTVAHHVRFPDEEEHHHSLCVERLKDGSGICNKTIEKPLHDVLYHLYCLALDPFYSGTERHEGEKLDANILRFRDLVYQNVDLSCCLKHPSYRDNVAEAYNLPKVSSVSPLNNFVADVVMEENIGVANGNRTSESQLLSNIWSKKASFEEMIENVKVGSRMSNVEDSVEPVCRLQRKTLGCSYVSETNKKQKTEGMKVSCSTSTVEDLDVAGLSRDISECNWEFDSNKTQKGKDVKVSTVESRDVVNLFRDTPDSESVISESNKRKQTDDGKVLCSISNVVGGDVVGLPKITSHRNGESESNKRQNISTFDDLPKITSHRNGKFESNKRQKISTFESVLPFRERSAQILHGDSSATPKDDRHKYKPSSQVLIGHLVTEADIDSRAADPKVELRPNRKVASIPSKAMREDIVHPPWQDGIGIASSQSHNSVNKIDWHPSVGASVDLGNKELSMGIVSRGSSKGNGRFNKHTIDTSTKTQQVKTLYSDPLLAESPASSGPAQAQCSQTHAHAEHPTSLHMKFPKDFKLPSKDELVKKFRPFGPLDYLKTNVFFYTGSAQVVFHRHLDAEAACQYAKRKKIFLGEADIRFWIVRHEHSRKGTHNISTPTSLPKVASLVPNLKSSLRVPNVQGEKTGRKHVHVKFLPDDQDLSSVAMKTKIGVLTASDSCEYSKVASPDISPQMIMLLEKCDQLVNKIKDGLGLQSFYSLFTHSHFDSAKFDDG